MLPISHSRILDSVFVLSVYSEQINRGQRINTFLESSIDRCTSLFTSGVRRTAEYGATLVEIPRLFALVFFDYNDR